MSSSLLIRVCACAGFLGLALLASCPAFAGGTQEYLKLDFEKETGMDLWRDVTGKAPPAERWEIRNDGNHYLHANKGTGIFGITIPLDQPINIDSTVATVEVKLKMRKTANTSQILEAGLTSRREPENQRGGPFDADADSGFLVTGFQYDQNANTILWRVDGLSRPYTEEKAVVKSDDPAAWHEWRIVFDHALGTLSLYTEEYVEKPVLVQKGVALDGVELNSLWICGAQIPPEPDADIYIDYDDISVSCTFNDAKK